MCATNTLNSRAWSQSLFRPINLVTEWFYSYLEALRTKNIYLRGVQTENTVLLGTVMSDNIPPNRAIRLPFSYHSSEQCWKILNFSKWIHASYRKNSMTLYMYISRQRALACCIDRNSCELCVVCILFHYFRIVPYQALVQARCCAESALSLVFSYRPITIFVFSTAWQYRSDNLNCSFSHFFHLKHCDALLRQF